MKEFMGLRTKTNSYLTDDIDESKKAKGTKKFVIKRKYELEDYKNCLEVTRLENKIIHLNNNKIDGIVENYGGFIINNKIILKSQQRFKRARHNAFTEEIDKMALSSNSDNRIQ